MHHRTGAVVLRRDDETPAYSSSQPVAVALGAANLEDASGPRERSLCSWNDRSMIRRKRKNLEDVEPALLDSLDEPPIRGVVPSFRPRGPERRLVVALPSDESRP